MPGLAGPPIMRARLRDLFLERDLPPQDFNITLTVPAYGVRMLQVTRATSNWLPNTGTANASIVANASGADPGNGAWKVADGRLLFECGSEGWDGPDTPPPFWITFDFGADVAIDGFALWTDGDGVHDVAAFQLLTAPSGTGPWTPVRASPFAAAPGTRNLQLFEGFNATARHWMWNITATGGNQPWVNEVQWRRQQSHL